MAFQSGEAARLGAAQATRRTPTPAPRRTNRFIPRLPRNLQKEPGLPPSGRGASFPAWLGTSPPRAENELSGRRAACGYSFLAGWTVEARALAYHHAFDGG